MPDSVSLRAAAFVALGAGLATGIALWTSGSAAAVLAAAAIAAGLLSLGLLHADSRRVSVLAQVARAMGRGDFGARADQEFPGEYGALADAIDEMGRGVGELINTVSREQNRLLPALNSSIDAVMAIDASNQIRFANDAAERLLGRAGSSLSGTSVVWVLPNPEVVEAIMASRRAGSRETCIIQRPGGAYLQVMTTPIQGGGEWASVLVFHDISDIKRVEQVRRDFIANVSHELRTPLASINAVIETLIEGAIDDKATALDFLARADAEVDRLSHMVEELLQLSRIESGEVAFSHDLVDVNQLLAETAERLQPQAEKLGITLDIDAASDLPGIEGDAPMLERAVVNLVQNALKFTPAGGRVLLQSQKATNGLTVTVSDTGTGIDPRDLPRVFERFYKADQARQRGGSGLGLAIVKHTVEAHGGQVSAESEFGKGSTFRMEFPLRNGSS